VKIRKPWHAPVWKKNLNLLICAKTLLRKRRKRKKVLDFRNMILYFSEVVWAGGEKEM